MILLRESDTRRIEAKETSILNVLHDVLRDAERFALGIGNRQFHPSNNRKSVPTVAAKQSNERKHRLSHEEDGDGRPR